MRDLSDRLRSLGVKVGAQDLPPPRRRIHYPIEQVIDGQFLDTPYGQSFVVESVFPLQHRQGTVGISLEASLRRIAEWAREPGLQEIDPHALIFLDTETTGIVGGTGTYAFLIGLGRLDEGGFHLAQYFMRDPGEELAQLVAVNGFLGEPTGLVTFNGKAFDVPLLNTRFIYNGERSPLVEAMHLDLLPLARRLWRDRLPSRALGSLEQQILGLQRTQEDVSGALIPYLYFDYLHTGDARPLQRIFYHNAMDILSMAALLNHAASMLEDPLNGCVSDGIDLIAIAKLFEDLGQFDEAARCYACGLDTDLPDTSRREGEQRWSLMEKRRENFPVAMEIWIRAAERGEIFALLELAKHCEHRLRDYHQALSWTQAGIAWVRSPDFTPLERLQWLPDLEHRQERLLRKLRES